MIQRTVCLIARDTDACRNQAIEKHLMDTLPDATAILFLWQNRQAVSIGCRQDPWAECAIGAFLSSGGQLNRRLSGGGALYQDMGVLNLSISLPKNEFDIPRQLSIIGMAAGAFGVQAASRGRGTLTASGRKFSASAYYKHGSAALHHGTLLVSADLTLMDQCLTTDDRKLARSGRLRPSDRLINLGRLNPAVTIDRMEASLCSAFARCYGSDPVMLDERLLDGASLEYTAAQFANNAWLFPREERFSIQFSELFPWGSVTVRLRTEHGVIRAARIDTDAMEARLFAPIEQALTGAPCLISGMMARIDQKLALLRDPHLIQIAEDVKTLIRRQLRGR